ncbi:UNVERIFIED_CONTAM: hypothetical protein GTU68_032980 [Idotea baltica]|nr:hypothetical protein [Idotea baltica]
MEITVSVNGKKVTQAVEGRTTLSTFLREDLSLTGTHIGCDTSGCGACTVHVDGKAVKSCTLLAAQVDGCEVKTIEGMATNGQMHPLQESFKEKHGLQCGFCTPGMIMLASDFLETNPSPSDEEIRHALEGNFCRCTGYHNIVEAIKDAAATLSA